MTIKYTKKNRRRGCDLVKARQRCYPEATFSGRRSAKEIIAGKMFSVNVAENKINRLVLLDLY